MRKARTLARRAETPDERKARLWALYVDGQSLSGVAQVAGRTPEAIRAMFSRMGKVLRPATFREPAYYEAKADEADAESKRLRALARELRRQTREANRSG